MKATLTIEVPDDFVKGDCKNCDYWVGYVDICGIDCNADNCPLEIQDKPIRNGKLYRVMQIYQDCNGCEHKYGYDESGYLLCKSPECKKRKYRRITNDNRTVQAI